MPENPRYCPIPTDEDSTPSTSSPPDNLPLPPPAYTAPGDTTVESPKDPGIVELPPDYEVAAQLPSYEEAERSKQQEGAEYTYPVQRHIISDNGPADLEDGSDSGIRLGTDCLFLMSFMIAFVFNWIGFAFAYCLTNTIASRYGALSGFGLSLVKWVFIIRHSECCEDYFDSQSWIWWLFVALGWLVFVRGILVYTHIKRLVRLGQTTLPRYWGLSY